MKNEPTYGLTTWTQKQTSVSLALVVTALMVGVQATAQPVTSVSAGYIHSVFLKSDGSLWAMGQGGYGELGDGTWNSTNKPKQVVSNGVIAIAAGWNHSLFLKSDGSLWGTGWNSAGQLGDGTNLGENSPE